MKEVESKKYLTGYYYTVSDEQIKKYLKIPIVERLRWLEEAQEFMYKALSPEKWKIMQKFRRGEI